MSEQYLVCRSAFYNCYYEKVGKNKVIKLGKLPFEIPENWSWIKLSSFCDIYTGDSINESDKNKLYRNCPKGYDYIGTKDVNFNHTIVYENGVKIPYDTQFKICPKSKILLCIEGGSAGKKIAFTSKDVCFGNKLACFNSWIIDDRYLYLFLQSPLFLQLFKNKLTGIISGVSINNLKQLFLPLPPLEEQERIVEKFKSCEPLLSRYELVEQNITLLETSLEEKLKASILQYAIEGKLVKQDPNDEPASVLLERIKAEKEKLISEGKIKRDKNDSIIVQSDDKNYYENNKNITKALPIKEIPNSWRWIRLDTLFAHNTGKALNSKNTTGTNLEYITTSNLYWNNFILNDLKKMYFLPSELQKCTVKKGDLLVCEGGDIGRAAIWNLDKTICIQNHIHRLRPYIFIPVEFYLLVLRLYKFTGYIGGKGIGIQGLSTNALGKLFLPLPPIEEQKRISKQVFAILKDYKIAL